MYATPISQHPTSIIQNACRTAEAGLAGKVAVESLRQTLAHAQRELAERREREDLLRRTHDAACASKFHGRTSYVAETIERLELERREIEFIEAAIRGLETALQAQGGKPC